MRDILHDKFCQRSKVICDWYEAKASKLAVPIYSSYDIRDAGFKVSNVDANIFPAGFNNICPTDKESAPDLLKSYLDTRYGSKTNRILLITEEHTQNPYYWDNVYTILSLLKSAGREVMVSFPRALDSALTLTSATGHSIQVHTGDLKSAEVLKFDPQLVISNNDFSESREEWADALSLPMNPPRELGWYQRKKSRYFKHYNSLVDEMAEVSGFDPFLLSVKTEVNNSFDVGNEDSRKVLAEQVDQMLAGLKETYKSKGINQEPFVFVKNNSGTYGLAVIRVSSGKEVLDWNYKAKKKMKAAKGGRDVEEVIIQEGIPSIVQSDGASAEPVIYMIGCQLAGGFLRTHSEKSGTESLNSPGAVYKRLCVSDLNVSLAGSPLENVYGWSAKLGLLAIALEAQEMGVQFKGYTQV
jgi:glutamate--cysteine ligase